MLVVIAVIGILSGIVITTVGPSRSRAKDTKIIAALTQAQSIAELLYRNDYSGVDIDGSTDLQKIQEEIDSQSYQGNFQISKNADATQYAMSAELSTERYYCIDSGNSAVEVSGRPIDGSCN